MCNCFTCSLNKIKSMSEQHKLLVRAVFYATQISEYKSQLRLLYSMGYSSGHLTDYGVKGEMAAIECNMMDAECLLSEITPLLKPSYRRLVRTICPFTKTRKDSK